MIKMKLNTQELIEVTNKKGEKSFFYQENGEWKKITQEQYNNIVEGEKNER